MIFSIEKWENNINKGDEVLVKSENKVKEKLQSLNGKNIT